MSADKCVHCGSVLPPADAGWFPTDEYRAVPNGMEPARIVGTIPVGGLFARTEPIDLTIISERPRWRTQRMWIRKWAESEWRPA